MREKYTTMVKLRRTVRRTKGRQTECEAKIKSWNLSGQRRRTGNRGERGEVGKGIRPTEGWYWLLWSIVALMVLLVEATGEGSGML